LCKPFSKKKLPGRRDPPWEFVEPLARELGFVAVGVSRAGKVPRIAAEQFDNWIGDGRHADMEYMARYRDRRFDICHPGMKKGATAVVVAAFPYGDGSPGKGVWKYVAAHARGRDYHDTVRDRLTRMADGIEDRFSGCEYRIFVDTAPVMERTWALSSGIGSLGKNGMILVPGVGSRVVLGEIVCAAVPSPPAWDGYGLFDLCGECDACLQACPTGALTSPAIVDCSRCLSYWTIEYRGPDVPRLVAGKMSLIFGCDICTSACGPLNVHNASALEPPPTWGSPDVSLEDVGKMDDELLQKLILKTPLERTGTAAIKRNARLVLTHQASRKRDG
jgi:epoxyqueuosine reductase